MPTSRMELYQFLAQSGIETKTTDHAPVHTVADSSDLHQRIDGAHSKNLFLKDKKGRIFLVTALHDTEIDLKNLHKKLGAQGRLSFGKPELLLEVLGVTPGSVTPFALINDRAAQRVTFILDQAMTTHDALNFHPLSNDATTTIARDDLLRFIKACGHETTFLSFDENDTVEPNA